MLEADEEILKKSIILEHVKNINNKKGWDEDPDYINSVSNASTYVNDIQGIIVGGINSRFWMLRKHFNSMSVHELN